MPAPGHSAAPDTKADWFQAWYSLLQTNVALMATLEQELQATTGLTLTTYEVLATLNHQPDRRMRMQDLAGAVLLSKSGTTRVVGVLENGGMVTREIPRDNRRVTYAVLTLDGTTTVERALPVFTRLVHEAFGQHLRPGDARALIEILSRIPRRPS